MGKKALAKQKKRERAAVEAAASGSATAEVAIQPVPGGSVPGLPADTAESLVDPTRIATQLNSVAIHLLRRLHREDAVLGLSGARLSALSVLVFGGPRTIGKLAEAEGVTPPSMTRLVAAMEAEALVQRAPSPTDARSVIIRATPQGEEIMLRGREQRVVALTGWLSTLEPSELGTLEHAAELLERILGEQTSGRRHST
jgi:DNA-binding MarR family transcriptional regulator